MISSQKKIIEIPYNPLPKQKEFHTSTAIYRGYIGGFGSGKTYSGCNEALQMALQYPRNFGLIGARTYTMLRDTTRKTFLEVCPEGVIRKFNKGENFIQFMNGSEIIFRHLEEPDKLKSLNLGFFYIDEASDVHEDVFHQLQGRLRLATVARRCGFVTSNPKGKDWLYRKFKLPHLKLMEAIEKYRITNDPADRELVIKWAKMARKYHLVQAPSTENTYLPEEYVENLLESVSDEYAARYISGEFCAFEGMVYKKFVNAPGAARSNVIDPFEIPSHWIRYRGIDFGFTNPFVCLWAAYDPVYNAFYFYDAHYEKEKLLSYHAEAINKRGGTYKATFADHDAQDRAELETKGITTVAANKAIVSGIEVVNSYFVPKSDGKPRIFFFNTPEMQMVLQEIEAYRYPEGNSLKHNPDEEPIKKDDHAMDAMRYIVYNHKLRTARSGLIRTF